MMVSSSLSHSPSLLLLLLPLVSSAFCAVANADSIVHNAWSAEVRWLSLGWGTVVDRFIIVAVATVCFVLVEHALSVILSRFSTKSLILIGSTELLYCISFFQGLRLISLDILRQSVLLSRKKYGCWNAPLNGPSTSLSKCHMLSCLLKLRYLVWLKKIGNSSVNFLESLTRKARPSLTQQMMCSRFIDST